jgi:SAM-dependent methyltransferase
MLRDLKAKGVPGGALLLNADAESLPLADQACDVVLASYVMFFVPDVPRAVAEFRRVLRPGGALLAVTMAHVYQEELRAVVNRALAQLGGADATHWGTIQHRFSLESGRAMLVSHMSVTEHRVESAFVFPAVEPVLAYVASSRDVIRNDLPSGRTWDDFMAALRDEVQAEIAAHGEFRVSKTAGVLIAVKPNADR